MMRFFLLFLILNLIVNAEDCVVCKNTIKPNAKYIKNSNGEIFCSTACAESRLPKCDVCGKKSSQYLTHGDKIYCSKECAATTAPRCSVCNKTLMGVKYLKNEKGVFCGEECYFSTIKKCALCAEKTLEMFKVSGKDFCSKCYALPKCDSCSLPSKGSKMSDGREICGSCQLSGIKDEAIAQKIYKDTKKFLQKKFKLETTEDLPMTLIDKTELLKLKGTITNRELGFYRQKEAKTIEQTMDDTGSVTGEKLISNNIERHIYILTYLPENQFRNVVAHELMHNWVANNYPNIKDLKTEEGLAEYTAYLVNLEDNEEVLAKSKIENKDPIYGDGFRLIKSWDQGEGINDIKAKLIELYGKK